MKALKQFEDFVSEGIVQRVSVNKARAESLVIESARKTLSLKERLEKIGINENNANDYVEYCYDTLMLLVRAKLHLNGYHASGQGAHEAEVSYLRLLGFPENDVRFADQIRYFRNGMLYYGTFLDKEYAEKVVEFTKRTYPVLKKMLQ
jgi:hypothetical protein